MDYYKLGQAIWDPIIVYILMIFLSRIIGKKLLGQLTFFDFVTGITLGTMGGAFVTCEVEGMYVLISSIVFALLVVITGYMTLKSIKARKLIQGEPTILMQNGKILEHNMIKLRYNQDDLMMQLREKDIFDMNEVEYAILETHGRLSVLKKNEHQAVTLKDLNLSVGYKGIATEIIRDGRIQEDNLKLRRLSHEWLYNQLIAKGVTKVEEVFQATLSTDGTLYVDLKEDKITEVPKVGEDDST